MPIRTTSVALWCVVVIGFTTGNGLAQPERTSATPTDAIGAIVDAFRTHPIVAVGEGEHNNEQGHAFRLALLRDRRSRASSMTSSSSSATRCIRTSWTGSSVATMCRSPSFVRSGRTRRNSDRCGVVHRSALDNHVRASLAGIVRRPFLRAHAPRTNGDGARGPGGVALCTLNLTALDMLHV